jgi:hypothetical protein
MPMSRAALALLFLLTALVPARASLFCEIPKTPDGFVALRAAPDAKSRIVVRMRAGDEVQLLEGKQDGWLEVLHWRGDSRLDPDKNAADTRRGWAHRRYIKECG